ncbi:hypothetical protein C6P40_003980 [Pichia californica]|uniref:Ribonuclease P/MRP protein subunit POP5 n=1 Tax=Pichia californica TaxID=460514 RepID=A0A9P7BF21_9ASCO|nr:hypothetical protein C6P42_005279 [[Candida] californica]KAG0690032.1 hypothetical protein C6P40_003980 [[Candida] californica]
MVRLKSRYILFQLRYPQPDDTLTNGLPNDIPTESTSTLNARILVSTLRLSMTKNFGDEALADTLTSFVIKYFSNKTSTGIIKVHRDALEKVLGAMFFVQTLEGRDVIWESVGISGSISKCERRAISRNKMMIRKIKKGNYDADDDNKNIDELLRSFNERIDGEDNDNETL